ncbi:hypothetical protein Tco_0546843 [Tanacetum coccineum]
MLAPSNYVQWKSKIKRYINTKPNSELIHYCRQNSTKQRYQWSVKIVPVTEGYGQCIKGILDTEPSKGMQLITRKRLLLCKQEEVGVQLNAEQADWKDDTDDDLMIRNLEAHNSVHDHKFKRDHDDQDDTDDLDQERDLLAFLIQKLKCEIDDSKIQKKS